MNSFKNNRISQKNNSKQLFQYIFFLGFFLLFSVNGWAQPTASISGSATVCLNADPPVITFTGASGTTPYSFSYTLNGVPGSISTDVGSSIVTILAPTGTSGEFTYSLVSVTDGGGTTVPATGSAIITVVDDPSISVNPVSPSSAVCIDGTLPALTVTASGGTPTLLYQWYSNTTNSTTGGTHSQVLTASSYTPLTTTAGTLYYYCVVSATGSGCGTVTSTRQQ